MKWIIATVLVCALSGMALAWTHGNPGGGGGTNFLLDGTGGRLLDGTPGRLIAL